MDGQKIIIYQIFTRLFGNRSLACKENGTIVENGCGKMNFFNEAVLRRIKALGVTHVWYTGIIRHASKTDYSDKDIPCQHPAVVKGNAGSPYAISDYYDVDPDLADDVDNRMEEFEALVERTHKVGLKVIIDFVPNHVARQYKSVKKPEYVKDLGETDDKGMAFSVNNNFYYCINSPFEPCFDLKCGAAHNYSEFPAKATGNDHFGCHPGINDWYETVKLNYGIDYCDAGGRSYHFDPIPDTWGKMTDILMFWVSKGIDGFRCDMAEMVPKEFWAWSVDKVKYSFPKTIFIGEVYNPSLYRDYLGCGFDYLYDKVGMYDCMCRVMCGESPASDITYRWQAVDDIKDHMLYFLENHDEQRLASDFLTGDARKGIPAAIVSALLNKNPFMLYAGQEFGERGMDKEGFSGLDGRTTIFDYWTVTTLFHGYVNRKKLTEEERSLEKIYSCILNIAKREKAVSCGMFFDLMYANLQNDSFDASKQYAFLRKDGKDLLLVVANFSEENVNCSICVPKHAFEFLQFSEGEFKATDLLTGEDTTLYLMPDAMVPVSVGRYTGRVYKMVQQNQNMEYDFNTHGKDEFPPAHTAEHLLNQTMIRMFGCERSSNAHVERKKSKISYILDHKPTRQEEKEIERRMNELIEADLPVTFEYVDREHIPDNVSLDKLPDDASDKLRLVRIGDYDVCLCIGKHVRSTSQIGRFEILGTNWDEEKHSFRIRFKVVQ